MHGTQLSIRRARIVRRDNTWTYRETEILREFWPDIAALRKALPHRKETAIKHMAQRCGVIPPKDQHIWTGAENKRMRSMAANGSTRKEIAKALGLSVGQVANRMRYTKTYLARRQLAPCSDPLADAVRRRAFALNMSIADLDRSLGNRAIFRHATCNKVSSKHISNAVKALGGRLTIVWDDEQ